MAFSAPPGVFDIIPKNEQEIWKSSYLWQYVEGEIRKIAKEYCFEEIRTPIFERTELLKRGVGEDTDIVIKEMYTFEDKGGRSLTLRPEGTAPAIRAVIENRLLQQRGQQRLFYICPMFRYERAQAGRYRQHHQFGAESLGSGSPETDAELIDMAYSLFTRLGIKNLKVSLNSIGDADSREKYKVTLRTYLSHHLDQMSSDSKARFDKNPLRILDSKDPQDGPIIEKAPSILDFLDTDSKTHFDKLQNLLSFLSIPFNINPKLVRGLDYYNRTVFEIVVPGIGAQNSIVGGGRYDSLVEELGGPKTPAAGFGSGIERVLQTLYQQNLVQISPPKPLLFLIPMGEKASEICFKLQNTLRKQGVAAFADFSGRKLNKLMSEANKTGATYAVVIGEEELASEKAALKEMVTGAAIPILFSDFKNFVDFLARIP
jgi:histidyl-tRNA synthetase